MKNEKVAKWQHSFFAIWVAIIHYEPLNEILEKTGLGKCPKKYRISLFQQWSESNFPLNFIFRKEKRAYECRVQSLNINKSVKICLYKAFAQWRRRLKKSNKKSLRNFRFIEHCNPWIKMWIIENILEFITKRQLTSRSNHKINE